MKITARTCMDMAFKELEQAIENGIIRPGTIAEREFLTWRTNNLLAELLKQNSINMQPDVVVLWHPSNPEEIKVTIDQKTIQALKSKGLMS